MNADQQLSRSLWLDEAQPEARPAMTEPVGGEVLVIGAGIAGLSVAYELQQAGRRVVVVDRGRIGGGMAARGSGQLRTASDELYGALLKQHGPGGARAYAESRAEAVDRLETIAGEEAIRCDFARVDGYLISASVDDNEAMDREHAAARGAGLTRASFADRAPLTGVDTGAALRFPDQARVHPLRYVLGLAAAFERAGGRIYGDTAVVEIVVEASGLAVTLENGTRLRFDQVVAAAHAPLGAPPSFHSRQTPFRTYLIAAEIQPDAAADILLWDTARPSTHACLHRAEGRDRLIVGGQDHRTGAADDAPTRFEALEAWARLRYPEMGAVTHRWSQQILLPTDGVPFVGAVPGMEGLFLVTGDSGEGVTAGVAAGLILRDLVQGRPSRWSALYDPSRTPLFTAAVADFVRERAGAVGRLLERMTPGEGGSADDLAPGTGAVTGGGGAKVASFRDEAGVLHQRSASCSHAPCTVRFNSLERCWDCPCHGCQYGIDGEVLAAPATQPLAAV